MPTVTVNDIAMYYEVHGAGAPLVLILGLATDLSEWGELIRSFSANFTVLYAFTVAVAW